MKQHGIRFEKKLNYNKYITRKSCLYYIILYLKVKIKANLSITNLSMHMPLFKENDTLPNSGDHVNPETIKKETLLPVD